MSLSIVLEYMGFALDRDYILSWDADAQAQRIEWMSEQPQPTPEEIEAARLPAERAIVVARIKAKARSLILARLPEWKQANATARAVELISLGQASGQEWEALQAAWAWVKSVRDYSNTLEAQAAQSTEPLALDIDSGWPD